MGLLEYGLDLGEFGSGDGDSGGVRALTEVSEKGLPLGEVGDDLGQ